jgi:microcystin synthetase protein McyJ
MNNLKSTSDGVVALYSKIRESVINKPISLWLNLGLWIDTDEIEQACKALVDKVTSLLKIPKGAKIFDAGFGYGVQDVYLAEKFDDIHIVGVNIVDFQIEEARKLIKQRGLQERVLLINEDATATTLASCQFDFVIAIESAFHFNTRERFFYEAFRLLKPGGKMALADCLPKENYVINDAFKVAAANTAIPLKNIYDVVTYKKKMLEVGFKNIFVEDITNLVLPAASQEVFNSGGWRANSKINLTNGVTQNKHLLEEFIQVTTIGKYYIITADK